MKKALLSCNVKLYAIIVGVSLLWIGFLFGMKFQINEFINHWDTDYNLEVFLYPAVYLILHRIGLYLEKEHEYASGKGYYAMTIVTLGFITLPFALAFITNFPELQDGIDPSSFVLDIVVPAILVFLSIIISVLYFICAIQTKRELKNLE